MPASATTTSLYRPPRWARKKETGESKGGGVGGEGGFVLNLVADLKKPVRYQGWGLVPPAPQSVISVAISREP